MQMKTATIYHGGPIITMDPRCPVAQAVSVVDGRISAVGSLEDVTLAAGRSPRLCNLGGRTLMPGFIDGHSHFPSGGMNRLFAANLAVSTRQKFMDALRKKLQEKRPSEWLIGHSFDEWSMEGQYTPTRKDLDEISTDIPIFYRHVSGHTGVANSRALELAGITCGTAAPAGGIIGRDASGELNGLLEGIPAQSLVRRLIPHFTEEEMLAALVDESRVYASFGVTTAQGGPAFSPMDAELGTKVTDIMLRAAAEGIMPIRVVLFIRAGDMGKLEPYTHHVSGSDLSGIGRVTLGAAKLWSDGDPRAHTGYFTAPYAVDDPAKDADYRGEFLYTVDELAAKILPMHRAGWQIAIHANGDAGIETVVSAYEAVQRISPRQDARHLVIHAQYSTRAQLARMKTGGIYPCFFISPLYYWGHIHEHFAGEDRVRGFCPCMDAESLGLAYNLHTDSPITPINPLVQVGVAVTRRSEQGKVYGSRQAVDTMSALRAVTLNAAFLNFEEGVKGSLTPGKYADMVVLDSNPLTTDPTCLKDIRVLQTIVGGSTVYEA